MSEAGIVIVGAGQAGAQLALSLRQRKYAGRITLLGDEFEPPYQRPPLSKAYMQGKIELAGMLLRNTSIYSQQDIDWRGGTRVHAIDRAARRVELTSRLWLDYSTLVLATGTRNRPLDVPGGKLSGVAYLRTFGEAQTLRRQLDRPRNIVVVGGGFIGLEFAAVASSEGHRVTVLESTAHLMSRALSEASSNYFLQLHKRASVDVRCNLTLTRVEGEDGRATSVVLSDGQRLLADLVVVGIGVLPNSDLARESGLHTDNGIRVNSRMETDDPQVFAIGDCASFVSPFLASHVGSHVRLESVQNAVDQAKHLAARLTGASEDYVSVPWFWSDQYDRKLQIAGLTLGADRWVVAGDPESGEYGVHCFCAGRWLGFESVNRPGDHMAARKILASGHLPSPDQVRENFNFRSWTMPST